MTVFSVTDFIAHINDVLARSWDAEDLCVEGEVSNFRVSQGQWVNFDLKDKDGLVGVFMTVWQLRVPIEDGVRVRVYGSPKIYPKFGKFSITATRVELVGEGALRKALLALRARLDAEGLFDPTRKRGLPGFPERIALVASRESAAYGDFVRILNERWRGLDIDLYHVKVQGVGAAEDIVDALRAANVRHGEKGYDALILTRGGGSLEELMSFNDEQVVRAIHASKIPTLVGIGHERDITLAEEAADVRGSTPTDCARRLVPDRSDVLRDLSYKTANIENALLENIRSGSEVIARALRSPAAWLMRQKQELGETSSRCQANMRQWLRALSERYRTRIRLLASLDPKGVLSRGYAMLRDARGRAVTTVSGLVANQTVTAVMRDGEGELRVVGARPSRTADQQKLL